MNFYEKYAERVAWVMLLKIQHKDGTFTKGRHELAIGHPVLRLTSFYHPVDKQIRNSFGIELLCEEQCEKQFVLCPSYKIENFEILSFFVNTEEGEGAEVEIKAPPLDNVIKIDRPTYYSSSSYGRPSALAGENGGTHAEA